MLLREAGERRQKSGVGPVGQEGDVDPRGRAVRCRCCGHPVTHTGERMEVNGQHEHVCVNPSGIPFHIGCFRAAPGCVPHGPAESYWSWFAGYRWQIALCGGCGTHLGWAFHGDAPFHGLVMARVVEDDGAS